MLRFGEQSKKRKAKCSAVCQMHARRDLIIPLKASNGRGAESVIAQQHIAQSQDKNANSFSFSLRHWLVGHELPALRFGKNL